MSQLKKPISKDDHLQGGDVDAKLILVEYGDYQCPFCGRAYPQVKEAQDELGTDLCFVFRNFPLSTLHPDAENAAEAAEIAGAFGKFWEMHDMLFENQQALDTNSLVQYALALGLDTEKFAEELSRQAKYERVHQDFMSGMTSGVNGTPTFFINGKRYDGEWEHGALLRALRSMLE
jgi:protein-disulfide isomerase